MEMRSIVIAFFYFSEEGLIVSLFIYYQWLSNKAAGDFQWMAQYSPYNTQPNSFDQGSLSQIYSCPRVYKNTCHAKFKFN